MKVVTVSLALIDLQNMASATFGNFVKAVVDIDQEILALDAELHSDLEGFLLEQGSEQKSLWGINLYPAQTGDGFIEFDSMINLRPSQNNLTRGVDDEKIRNKIKEIVSRRIHR